jgi:hypothetical protein
MDCGALTRAQLLAYAVGTREFLLEHRHVVTLNRDVVEKFYPLLADVILEVWPLDRLPALPCPMHVQLTGIGLHAGAAARQRR